MPSASERATLFFPTTSVQYVAQAFCPPIGGWLMNLDGQGGTPEVAMTVSLATALLAAFVTIAFFPETLDKSECDRQHHTDQDTSNQEDQLRAPGESNRRRRIDCAVMSRINKTWKDIKLGVSGAGFGNILLLAMSIIYASIGIKAMGWSGLIQYPVIKLAWTFPQVRELSQVSSPVPESCQGIVRGIRASICIAPQLRASSSQLTTALALYISAPLPTPASPSWLAAVLCYALERSPSDSAAPPLLS
jgi:hypothetical protein